MKKLFLLLLFVPAVAFASQHVLFGRDWLKMSAPMKTMVLEGMIMGWFSAQEVVGNELLDGYRKIYGKDLSPDVLVTEKDRINKAVVLQLSRFESEAVLVKIVDDWASENPDADLPEAISALIMNKGQGLCLDATATRGPSSGYNDVAKHALDLIQSSR